jgi:hypothetical protein
LQHGNELKNLRLNCHIQRRGGSSAIRTAGRQESAIAIITR